MADSVQGNIKKHGHAKLLRMIRADLAQNSKDISSTKNAEKLSGLKQDRIYLNQLKDLVREDRAMKNAQQESAKKKLKQLSARGRGGGGGSLFSVSKLRRHGGKNLLDLMRSE